MKKKLILLALSACLTAGLTVYIAETSNAAANNTTTAATQQIVYINATPLEIVKTPAKYLNKNVRINATFDKFTNLGLDYKPALRSSQDYISFLILRDDVNENIIPLSEMKLFLKRTVAEKFIDLEVGDKIQIEGKVFSNALSDTWIDVSKITVTKKKNPKKA